MEVVGAATQINGVRPVNTVSKYQSDEEERVAKSLVKTGSVVQTMTSLGLTWDQYHEIASRKSFQETYWEIMLTAKVYPKLAQAIGSMMEQAAVRGNIMHTRLILEIIGKAKSGDTYNVLKLDAQQIGMKLDRIQRNLTTLGGADGTS